MKVKIAIVQFKINDELPIQNISRMKSYVQDVSGKADVIIFPEYFLHGGIDDSKGIDHGGKYLNIIREIAKKYNIDIVPGSLIEEHEKRYKNVAYYIGSDGNILGRYEKISLWKTEKEKTIPGKNISVFNTRFGKAGLAICWDLIHPEIFAAITEKGAKIIYCPSLWFKGSDMRIHKEHNPEAQKMHVNALCKARAIENSVIIAYSNAIGKVKLKSGYDDAIGQSQITMPVLGTISNLDEKEGILIEEVDLSIIDEARRAYGINEKL